MSAEQYSFLSTGRDEEELFFSGSSQDQACIGHLRGDFGCGTEFWTTWWDHQDELKSPDFHKDLNALVNSLRKDGPLKDLRAMLSFCGKRSQSRLSNSDMGEYGFRVDTARHRYYLRFLPKRGEYNFYIYCYQTDKLERSAPQAHKEEAMSEDKIKVLVVEPLKPCEVREISGLKAMQDIVGGHLQAVYPFHDEVALVCNEDGKILDLPYNRPLTNDRGIPYDMICGTFFLAGVGAEDFVSLTDEQIQKFSALYDNMMVVTAEIAPDAVLSDYAVSCVLSFRLTHEGQEPSTFAAHITEIFNKDEALALGAVDNPVFTFQGRCAEAQYTFASQDKDEASAEAFAEQCVRNVQKQMEQCGCKLEKVECFAEKLEPDVVHTKKQTRGQGSQGKKKGNHHER